MFLACDRWGRITMDYEIHPTFFFFLFLLVLFFFPITFRPNHTLFSVSWNLRLSGSFHILRKSSKLTRGCVFSPFREDYTLRSCFVSVCGLFRVLSDSPDSSGKSVSGFKGHYRFFFFVVNFRFSSKMNRRSMVSPQRV